MIGHFKIHYWLSILFAVAFAGALYPRFDSQTILVTTLIFSLFNLVALRLSWHKRRHIEKLKALADYVAVFGMLVFVAMLLIGNLLDALILFIAFVQLALNLTFKSSRHYYYGLMVSFVLLSVGAAESKTGFYLFYIIAYCAVASVSLGYYFMDNRLQKNHGTHQRMTWPIWHQTKVVMALIALSFIIYIITPRFGVGNLGSIYGASEQYYSDKDWEEQAEKQSSEEQSNGDTSSGTGRGPGQGQSGDRGSTDDDSFAYRGFSNSFDIRGGGQEGGIPPNVIVAYMQAKHGAYLKVETFDKFDGISWYKSLSTDIKRKLQYGRIELQEDLIGNYRQGISIEENLGPFIPAASIPVDLTFPSTVVSVDAYEMLKIPSGLAKGTHYSVDSSVKFINGRLFSGDHYQPRENDLQLPKGFDKRIRELSEKITQGKQTQLRKAAALEKYLRNNYAYSYDSIFSSQHKTPVAKFLFEDKKGHCEYFASSMAVMLRSLGIHSRLVTGFSATVQNPLSGYYEMRVLDGHAWVEAWVDGIGWAVFEATPFYTPAIEKDEVTSFEKIQNYVEQLRKIQEESGNSGEWSLENILTSLWHGISLLFVIVFSTIKLFILQTWKILIVLAIISGIGFILWKRWQPVIMKRLSYLRVKAYKPTDHNAAIKFYMKHIQIIMRFNGMPRYAGTTIEQYMNYLRDGLDAREKKAVADLINGWHYSIEKSNGSQSTLLKSIFMKLYKNTSRMGTSAKIKQL